MARRRRTATATSGAGSRNAEVRGSRLATRLLTIGVLLGGFGVGLAFLLGGQNPFGAPKFLTLMTAAVLVAFGFALDPSRLASTWMLLKSSRLAWTVAAGTGITVLATFTALDVRQALLGNYPDYRGLVSVVAFLLVGMGAVVVWTRPGGKATIARASVVSLLVVVGFALLQRIGVIPADWKGAFRISSTVGNPSNLGVWLGGVVPLVAWCFASERAKAWRVASGVAGIGGMAALLWTLSRGAWVGAIAAACAGVALWWWLGRGSQERIDRRWLWAAPVLALMLVALAFAMPGFTDRVQKLIDPESGTASWRLSTWRSSAAMIADRPFLGFGPDNFRLAYRQYEEPGQIKGRYGYQVVESAHNLVMESGTSSGVVALIALVLTVWFCVRALVGTKDPDRSFAIATAVSLMWMFSALQFHYVTMDTGGLLFLWLAAVISTEPVRVSESSAHPWSRRDLATLRLGASGVAVAYGVVTIMAGGLVIADNLAAQGLAAASAGAPWPVIAGRMEAARGMAAWEPLVTRVEGTAAGRVLSRRADAQAFDQGLAALTVAAKARPYDAVLAAERANLLMMGGIRLKDPKALTRAVSAFDEVAKMDPNTGIPLAGKGSALLALGRYEAAIPVLERAMELSPKYALGWRNLAKAYAAAGDSERARMARDRAKALK